MAENPNQDPLVEKYREALANPGQAEVPQEAVETQEKESSIQKLKRQRNEARDAVSRLTGRLEALEAQSQRPQAQLPVKDDEIGDLRHLAFSDDKIQENPGVANQAVLELAKKIADEKVAAIKEELKAEISGTVRHQNELVEVQNKIQREYGAEALSPESDLYRVANDICAQKRQAWAAKYGDKVGFPSELILSSFQEARGVVPKPEVKAEEATKPAPQDMVEGGGVYPSADELATIKAAAAKAGNVDDAFAAVSRSLGY